VKEREREWGGAGPQNCLGRRGLSGPKGRDGPVLIKKKGKERRVGRKGKRKERGGERAGLKEIETQVGLKEKRGRKRERELRVGFKTFETLSFCFLPHNNKQNQCKGMYAFNHLVNSKFNIV
jgi:hypothetical protein